MKKLIVLIVLFCFLVSKKEVFKYEKIYNGIKSIVYIETIEGYSQWDGKLKLSKKIFYSYPDKLRIDYIDELNSVEIINGDKYYYSNDRLDHVKVRWNIPIINLDIFELMKNLNGKEILGYEIKDDLRLKIIGIKSKVDNVSYLTKVWIGEFKGYELPFKVEYFVNNKIVSLKKYEYFSVNDILDNNLFSSLNFKKRFEFDGSEACYITLEDAKRFINFFPILSSDKNYFLSEVKLIKSDNKVVLGLAYLKDNFKIEVYERKANKEDLKDIKFFEDKVLISFCDKDVYFEVLGPRKNYSDILNFCLSLSKNINFMLDGEYKDGQDNF
ncbi:hypothetical protein SAMN05660865_01816 [Caloramator fervidus]|uniref:MucB/RseB N-terminal domain-containing protein n=1 Tax=Caloramator fervidus TaxID=29344 RepID=A0A1H5XN40_9CLOT|nr:hypothetical protein [Caloramator fervidus]SEG13199.1 hypothetical protein SAMN05660865_01816 [Caloramator fervidus]